MEDFTAAVMTCTILGPSIHNHEMIEGKEGKNTLKQKRGAVNVAQR